MVNIIHLNTLLGIMITVLLDHYNFFFHKLLDTLINLIKIISLMIKYMQRLKSYNKIWTKLGMMMKNTLKQK